VRHHDGMGQTNDSYEEDEPLEDVVRAFHGGQKGLTTRPVAGRTENFALEPVVVRRGWTESLNLPGILKLVSDLTTTASPRVAVR
jgi:hypothetical protein